MRLVVVFIVMVTVHQACSLLEPLLIPLLGNVASSWISSILFGIIVVSTYKLVFKFLGMDEGETTRDHSQ